MANMCRSRTGDWSVVIGPGLALALGLLYIFVYIFSFSSLVRVVANLRRCLHYHINTLTLRLASLVKKAVIYAYCTKELFDICRENVSHMATLHSVAKHVIHADNLGPRH